MREGGLREARSAVLSRQGARVGWRRAIAALSPGLAILTVTCSPLLTFNAAVPKDRGSRLVLRDAAFGPDPRQRLDVYAPTASRSRRPILIFFYGGSWNSGTKVGYAFVGRAFAAQGFVVIVPDYRLVPAVRYPAFLEDNAAAVRWARAHAAEIGGDPDRIVLAGHSAGAYDAAMLALDPRWLGPDRAAVRGWIGLAGPYDFLPLDGPVTRAAFGNVADPASTQPISYAAAGDPPAFLATGDKDVTVRTANSDNLAARLRTADVDVERRRYPALGHVGVVTALARPLRDRAPVLADAAAFARRVTGER